MTEQKLQKPSSTQIRAAMAMLEWENEYLGKLCGVTGQSISNIKRGATRPQPRVISAIRRVLEFHGIEFLENSGVRFKSSSVEIFEGMDRFHDFTEFVYEHVKCYGGDICINAVDETLFLKYRKDLELYRKRMKELVDRGDITVRIIATESNFSSIFAQMKWQPTQSAAPTAFYAFGNCLALISFAHEPPPYVVLHKSGPFAEAYRQAFNIAWKNAQEPPKSGNKR